jgi:hypothetical protein
MTLPFTTPLTSKFRYMYRGPVGVAGVLVPQSFDISFLPPYVRASKEFKNNWRVFVRQIDTGVTDCGLEPDFLPAVGTPTELVLLFTAAAPTDVVEVEAWYMHSVIR